MPHEGEPERPVDRVGLSPKPETGSDVRRFSTDFIKERVFSLLKDQIEVKSLDVQGVGEKIKLVAKLNTEKVSGDININATLENKDGLIALKDHQISVDNSNFFKRKTGEILVGIKINPHLDKISETIREFIEKEKRKKVKKMEIENGELKVTFVASLPTTPPNVETKKETPVATARVAISPSPKPPSAPDIKIPTAIPKAAPLSSLTPPITTKKEQEGTKTTETGAPEIVPTTPATPQPKAMPQTPPTTPDEKKKSKAEKIAELKETIEGAEKRIKEIEITINSNTTTINSNEARIKKLQRKLKELPKEKEETEEDKATADKTKSDTEKVAPTDETTTNPKNVTEKNGIKAEKPVQKHTGEKTEERAGRKEKKAVSEKLGDLLFTAIQNHKATYKNDLLPILEQAFPGVKLETLFRPKKDKEEYFVESSVGVGVVLWYWRIEIGSINYLLPRPENQDTFLDSDNVFSGDFITDKLHKIVPKKLVKTEKGWEIKEDKKIPNKPKTQEKTENIQENPVVINTAEPDQKQDEGGVKTDGAVPESLGQKLETKEAKSVSEKIGDAFVELCKIISSEKNGYYDEDKFKKLITQTIPEAETRIIYRISSALGVHLYDERPTASSLRAILVNVASNNYLLPFPVGKTEFETIIDLFNYEDRYSNRPDKLEKIVPAEITKEGSWKLKKLGKIN